MIGCQAEQQAGTGGSGARDAGEDGGGTGGSSGTHGGSGGTGGMTGGTGGMTGGTGGDAATPACTEDAECPATRPQCNASGECATCTSSAACEDRDGLAYCETTTGSPQRGQCVACLEDEHCDDSEDGEYCLNNSCVPCKTDSDCTDLTKPECGDDGQCTGCTSNAACDGRDGTEACVTAPGPKRGSCVECLGHADCDNPTPQCSNNACVSCTNNDACEDRAGKTVCDTSSDATFGGSCVECTGSSYDTCTQGAMHYVCESLDRTCSTTALEHTAQPCQSCVADAHCRSGTLCMQTKFGSTDVGAFCLWQQAATGAGAPDGNCANVRPYIGTEATWSSVEGSTATVCKPAVTTCQGQNQFRSQTCDGPTAGGHAQCGAEGVADAYCAPFTSGHRCTVPCVSYDDCQDVRPGPDTDTECETQMIGSESIKACVFQ